MGRLDVSLTSWDYAPGTPALPQGSAATVGFYQISVSGAPTFTVQGPQGQTPGLFAIPNHGLTQGTPVVISQISGTSVFVVGTTYYVQLSGVTDTFNTFFLTAVQNVGTGIVPTNNAAGVMFTPGTNHTHTISMQPQRYGETWTVDRIIIQNSSQIKVPSCTIYRGAISLAAMVDTTPNGIFNTDDLNSPITVTAGEPVIIQFVGCDPPTASSPVYSTVYLTGVTNR